MDKGSWEFTKQMVTVQLIHIDMCTVFKPDYLNLSDIGRFQLFGARNKQKMLGDCKFWWAIYNSEY